MEDAGARALKGSGSPWLCSVEVVRGSPLPSPIERNWVSPTPSWLGNGLWDFFLMWVGVRLKSIWKDLKKEREGVGGDDRAFYVA